MTPKKASQRYTKAFVPITILYVISCFAIPAIIEIAAPPKLIVYVLAIIPAFLVFGWIWSMGRLIRETDEFIRKVYVEQLLYALMLTMGVTTTWGFLEFFADVPSLPIFFALPIFFFFFGMVACYSFLKAKNGDSREE